MKQLLAHLFGDYVLQTHWEATQKTEKSLPALSHAIKYTAGFVPLTKDWRALAVIGGTHYVLDRYRLAKQVSWAKNQLAPAESRYSWEEGKANAGYPESVPPWLSTWLMIISDNTIHMTINYLALEKFNG
jgi:hypothetical protein